MSSQNVDALLCFVARDGALSEGGGNMGPGLGSQS